MTDKPSRPVFVVGCQRSGTTMLRLMLDSHRDLSCGPETRFLADFADLTGASWDRLGLYGFAPQYWHAKAAEFFASFQRDYAASRGKRRWIDKTPRYALSMEYIGELFPDCQFVHVLRDGRDVVESHRDRWGWWSAVKAVEKWPRYVRAARAAGRALPADRYYEVRYEDVVSDPEKAMRGLLEFLGEEWDPAVLHHEDHPHDIGGEYSQRAPTYRGRAGTRRRLNPALRLLVWVRARAALREAGY